MTTSTWKSIERKIARSLGGERRGPDVTHTQGGGRTDTKGTEPYAIEIKHRKKPSFTDCEMAVNQAAASIDSEGQCPVAVIHRAGDIVGDSLVVMRFSTFSDWFGPINIEQPITDLEEAS